MKTERVKRLLVIEALVCAAAVAALRLWEGAAFSLADFPAGVIGNMLTALAGTGRIGFALAFTLYAALVLLPVYALVRLSARRALKAEDALIGGAAVAAAAALWPRGFLRYWDTLSERLFARLAWQWLILALLVGWVVLRLLRRLSDGGTQELLKLFRVLLALAAVYFVFAVCFSGFAELLSAIDTLRAGNTALTASGGGLLSASALEPDGAALSSGLLPLESDSAAGAKSLIFSYAVLALRFAAKSLPSLFAAATAYFAVGLLDTMEDGTFTKESAQYAPRLAVWCVKALKISVLFALAVNALQAMCMPLILSAGISVRLPLFELCFVLAALLGARLIASNVALKAESDLII